MKRILIIGDSEFERRNRIDIVEQYKELNPDIVILDITISGFIGIEILRLIKTVNNNARVILFSKIKQDHMICEAIKEGAIAFIVKPLKKYA
jgi:two-component system, chemotaxis family, chemotaxis protein CheY